CVKGRAVLRLAHEEEAALSRLRLSKVLLKLEQLRLQGHRLAEVGAGAVERSGGELGDGEDGAGDDQCNEKRKPVLRRKYWFRRLLQVAFRFAYQFGVNSARGGRRLCARGPPRAGRPRNPSSRCASRRCP